VAEVPAHGSHLTRAPPHHQHPVGGEHGDRTQVDDQPPGRGEREPRFLEEEGSIDGGVREHQRPDDALPQDQRRERDTEGDGVGDLADGLEQGRADQYVREMRQSEQNRRHDDRPPLTAFAQCGEHQTAEHGFLDKPDHQREQDQARHGGRAGELHSGNQVDDHREQRDRGSTAGPGAGVALGSRPSARTRSP
jgi:hypothetical protein